MVNSSPLIENSIEEFRRYLVTQGRRNTKQILICCKRYGYILQTNNASELLTISPARRHHAMEALAALAKYQGRYDQWLLIKQRYQLKWSDKDSLDIFKSIIDANNEYSAMVSWLKGVCQAVPKGYANILLYDTLVGLRPAEACDSISLTQNGEIDRGYLNMDMMVLEHYRYPSIFIRNSKKAFISIVNEDIISLAKDANNCGYAALRNYLKRRQLDMHIGYCRKIAGTYLRIKRIESETIDLLQGRISRTVFARHCFRPDFEEQCKRIRDELASLMRVIIS
jgi:hypothetical protein